MKKLWITLGALTAVAVTVYLLKDNENVKTTLDKINDKANNTLGKLSSNWKKATDQFNRTVAGHA